mmetsp:Transcript_17333/g.55177  ORF Transcript_17333/g.55177 Transcript_17333/m.55177 type:complete len:122 (-) Transcript_17333:106-471(-)
MTDVDGCMDGWAVGPADRDGARSADNASCAVDILTGRIRGDQSPRPGGRTDRRTAAPGEAWGATAAQAQQAAQEGLRSICGAGQASCGGVAQWPFGSAAAELPYRSLSPEVFDGVFGLRHT